MNRFVYFLNVLWIIVYCLVITAAFGVQIFEGEKPCPLCYLQRVAMISVSTAALCNLFFGVRPSHYGMALFSSIVGGTIAIRQISLHICPAFPTFGEPFWGISLYTWSFFTFVASILAAALLLMLYRVSQSEKPEKVGFLAKIAAGYLLLIIVGNIISVLIECGLGVCEA